jgi:hypothetical protein
VDAAIEMCDDIGDIREDIAECWVAANNPDSTLESANETRQLGLHYLQRYALLIMFRVYLQVNPPFPFRPVYPFPNSTPPIIGSNSKRHSLLV